MQSWLNCVEWVSLNPQVRIHRYYPGVRFDSKWMTIIIPLHLDSSFKKKKGYITMYISCTKISQKANQCMKWMFPYTMSWISNLHHQEHLTSIVRYHIAVATRDKWDNLREYCRSVNLVEDCWWWEGNEEETVLVCSCFRKMERRRLIWRSRIYGIWGR